ITDVRACAHARHDTRLRLLDAPPSRGMTIKSADDFNPQKKNRALAGPVEFAGVGAPTITFQRGTAACTSVAYLGGWQQPTAQQHNRSMRFSTQSHNAKGNMSAMRSSQSAAETHFDARRYGRLALCKIVLKKV
ncbi:MAG: hypothetical protein WBE82_13745, partial [Xanthobacteraceae bacterium]